MSSDQPSELVILQRIRNNIIDSLELTASFDEQREFQRRVPGLNVPSEVLDLWWASVPDNWRQLYESPVFTDVELQAIAEFDSIYKNVCDSTPEQLPALEEMLCSQEWQKLRNAAVIACSIFAKRGRLSMEKEDV